MKPEIKMGLSFADYCQIDAVNATKLLNMIGNTPAMARWLCDHDEETEALVRGHAAHSALLQPEVFATLYAKKPGFNRRTNAGKEEEAAWDEAHKGNVTVPEPDHELALILRDKILKTPHMAELFGGAGQNEVTILWTDKETGLDCKARVDRLTEYHGYQMLVDYKTTRSTDDYHLMKTIADLQYHARMAFYMDALNVVHATEWRVVLAWACTVAPYEMRLTEFLDNDMDEGRAVYRHCLTRYAECMKSGEWPSYAAGIEPLGLPRWAYKFTTPKEG